MGGLGKTTLVQEVGRKAEKDKLFNDIVFVRNFGCKKVQTEIADKLGVEFNNESERQVGYMRDGIAVEDPINFRHILEDLDLKTIGIPSKMDHGGCNVIQTCELNSLSNDVCKECGGLPIVICTIAKALRNKRQKSQWEDALRVLRMPSPTKFTRLLEKEYLKIKLSYDYLEDDELKKTFIISSLMENNTSLSDLFKNIFSLGILEGANLTIEQARNRLDLVVKELKDSCLLLDGSTEERFSMHDVVRIIAITCGYIDHHVFTKRNDVESEWKDKDKLGKCTMISVVGNNIITQLSPEGLDFPELEFFYMSKGGSFRILKEFFAVMPKLKVLNLFKIQQSSLPSSLDLLTNLQTLCLEDTKIEDIAIIGKLEKLKILSLKNSNLEELPTEIGRLTQLRLLDLSNCVQLQVIAPNVISKLSQLEELYMKGCCIQWKVEELKELKHLSQLTSLEIDIEDNKMLPEDFFFKELRRCKITIGDWSRYARMDYELLWSFGWRNYECSRMLEFKYDSSISSEELQIFKNVELLRLAEFSEDDNNLTPLFNKKVIFSNLMALELKVTSSRKIWDIQQPPTFMSSLTRLNLHGCRKIKYAFPISVAKSLSTLQDLQISNCKVLEEIVAEEGAKAVVDFAFPQVTFLKLENLPKLTAFYHRRDFWQLPILESFLPSLNLSEITQKHFHSETSLTPSDTA
ncbi:probable disease resistance protein At4g27220 [Pistacia vera]|uniref:probable disease resistance protein At4g27220 n=1 Tax=Pistacia vera TaxID=55513 RepID=UPI001263B10C|nr:probable disease resistance protein At4g27220 [Pistacia vera]